MIDRSREARRASGMVASSNGLSRRRHRSNSLRDSPDEDGPVELQESVRLRERLAKKDRDRVDRGGDRERVDREIIRDNNNNREIREREIIIRERSSRSSSKRRRGGDRLLIHGGDGENDTSNEEESVNDEEEVYEDQENNNHSGGIGGGFRLLQPNSAAVGSSAGGSSISNHYHNNNHHTNNINLHHRKSFPPSSAAKVFRAAPVWKPGDEMIGVSVPRKARSASIKRSHDWMSNTTGGGNGGVGVGGVEQSHRQASTSPVRQNNNLVSTSTPSPAAVAVAAPPMSPSSSNVSVRKKLKPNNNNGPTKQQHRPPKSSYLAKTVSSSSNAEQLEIEIAEVLFGLKTQSQAAAPPFPKKELLSNNNDSSEANNRSSSDAKSRVSSPISNSPSPNIQSSPAVILPPNSCSSAGVPLSATAPKRKKPRQVSEVPGSYSVRISPISSTAAKMEIDQTPKTEISSPNLEKIPGSDVENVHDSGNLELLPMPELMKSESEVKSAAVEGLGESQDVIPKEESISSSSRKDSPEKPEENVREAEAAPVTTKASSAEPEVDNQREEKFQIDLEAPPPQSRSSPERENEINMMGSAMDHKPIVMEEMKPVSKDKEDEKVEEMVKEEEVIAVRAEEKKAKLTVVEESGSQNRVESKVRNIDLQLDLEKPERDSGLSNKIPQQGHKQLLQQPPKATKEEPHDEKTGHSSSLPLPMSMASWPGGLPPMGYMTPIQGVVSMDGTAVSPAPIQPIFSQPRPKRCATHCYIARNIHYLQQFMKMNQFWPAVAATPASLFGSKPPSVVSPADLHGSLVGRAVNSGQEKPPGLAIFPSHGGKDTFSQPANMADASQRKQQIFLQQAMPAVAPNNILHGPAAFIFPLSQQPPAVAAASARPASIKPPTSSANLASTSASTSAAASTSAPTGGGGGAVSFNYPNMPTNETQYLAILQNNAYPFPIPAAVGAPPNYRGTHPQPLPMFNGSFYSSQIIHASQLQQAQQQSVSQSQQMQQQNHQNTSLSSGSSSSHKHLQSQQQQRPTGSAVGGGNGSGNLHNFPAPKTRQSQQSQQQINPSQARQQLENETGAEDSPSTADSRGARGPVMNIYGQNFAMPIHPQNYALLATSAGLANATTSSSNQSEKKQQQLQQQQQQQGKNGVESLPPQAFAMSFASMNGASTGPGIDFSSMAQNHALLQSLPEATRHNIQIMAATAAAQAAQRRNFRISEEGKSGGADSSNAEGERKGGSSGKPPVNSGQSIAFSRSDFPDTSGTATNNVVDSSTRSLNIASAPAWTARSSIANSLGAASVSNVQLQAQHQQQQQQHQHQQHQHQHQHQQMMQLHNQHQHLAAASAARNKNPATSNGSVYPEHMTSTSSMATKFPNALSGFPQNLVQTSNNSSPSQSPQWKNSARTNISQAPSSFVTSTTSSLKTLQQQQGRTQQNQTQISFGANQKTSAAAQGQQGPGSVQSPSSPMMVGSPSTSSMSKGANGSPRNNSASASSKTAQASSNTTQQAKNSSIPGQRSSPVGGRNVPSILGNPHIASTSNSGSKSQMQQQQQLSKSMQQAHPFFSSPYFQSQSPQSTNKNASAASGGHYIQRRHPDQQQQPQQQQQFPGSCAPSSTAMLTLCPVSLAGSGTSDPAKAMAAATVTASNMKGGGLPSQSVLQAQFAVQSAGNQHQVLPAGFPYTVPAAVQVKPAEQKQPAGNDNLHACWQPEKK